MANFELNIQSAKNNLAQIQQIRETLRSFGPVRLTALQNQDEVIIGVGNVDEGRIQELSDALSTVQHDIELRRTDKIEKTRKSQ